MESNYETANQIKNKKLLNTNNIKLLKLLYQYQSPNTSNNNPVSKIHQLHC